MDGQMSAWVDDWFLASLTAWLSKHIEKVFSIYLSLFIICESFNGAASCPIS
jgi:hypothetical protein